MVCHRVFLSGANADPEEGAETFPGVVDQMETEHDFLGDWGGGLRASGVVDAAGGIDDKKEDRHGGTGVGGESRTFRPNQM